MTRDATKQFDGEQQIEKTLVSNPLKLYLDVEKEFDAVREKSEELLWPENQDETRWADAADRYAEQAGYALATAKGTRRDSKTSPVTGGCGKTSATGTLSKITQEEADVRTGRDRAGVGR